MEKPPYSPAEMIDFYGDGEFTHGCSVDHVIFDFVQDDEAKSMAQDQLDENRRRFEITSENAELFLKESKRLETGLHRWVSSRDGPQAQWHRLL